ncbi:hypothetical protein [Meiothermus taiwanensis]|uniref:DUF4388 domain-containing protein n=1 Tax=Meiothermus taiwanensis WR-220 TaxID=1339250 RepID=A0ABM6WGV7_9DEIN|nr:hypothetical protein [Meiothermus taiwanensis]AWR86181.1 hypothetical protein Mtai_v1c09370 [Meiothermus taiwanensis WR-220]KIQ54124.1 hypothetical protein SY28_10275 [Meiothermus taiwanensis]KZK14793.1 hypothetical protein A3962_12675 [Meiothermus taiwanensis]
MSAHRGLLECISPSLMGSLLDALWPHDPLVERVPGGLLAPALIERLREDGFSGYLLARFSGEERGWLVFYRGRLLEAWRQATYGHLTGTVAYRALQRELNLATISIYRLQPDDLPPLVALTQGSLRMSGVAARGMAAEDLTRLLVQEQFTGALVHEDGLVGRAWFLARGRYLFDALLPEHFAEGVLHLVQAPSQAPLDLLELARQEDETQRSLRLNVIWHAAQEVLKEYMGRGAASALERLQHIYAIDDPPVLEKTLRRWMTESLEPHAAVLFDRLLRPTL